MGLVRTYEPVVNGYSGLWIRPVMEKEECGLLRPDPSISLDLVPTGRSSERKSPSYLYQGRETVHFSGVLYPIYLN